MVKRHRVKRQTVKNVTKGENGKRYSMRLGQEREPSAAATSSIKDKNNSNQPKIIVAFLTVYRLTLSRFTLFR